MRCGNCSNELPDTARFCGRCGAPVTAPTTGHLMTHSPDSWTYGGTSPDGSASWASPGADDTSIGHARPSADAAPGWDGEPGIRATRTARMIGAVTLAVLVGLGGTVAWAATRTDDTPLTTTPQSAAAGASQAPDPFLPTSSTPAVPEAGPSTSATGSGDGASVTIGPAAAADPDAPAVANLLQRHFGAINAKDFDAWVATVTTGRARDQTRTAWMDGFGTTQDRDVVLESLTSGGSGSAVATVTFTSNQSASDAPDGVSTQLCWTQQLPIAGSGSTARLGLPAKGSTTRRTC